MAYYFSTRIQGKSFEDVIALTTAALKQEGFGIITTINMQAAMHEKLGKEILPYTILGACNPGFAYEALQHEPHIGVMLPCNVVVRALNETETEVFAVDPVASMQAVPNPDLGPMAQTVQAKMQAVIAALT